MPSRVTHMLICSGRKYTVSVFSYMNKKKLLTQERERAVMSLNMDGRVRITREGYQEREDEMTRKGKT